MKRIFIDFDATVSQNPVKKQKLGRLNMPGRFIMALLVILIPYFTGLLLDSIDPMPLGDEPIILLWAVGLLAIMVPIGAVMLLVMTVKWIVTGNFE